jgi:subfamily B ATP-binding cassette protein MsbA
VLAKLNELSLDFFDASKLGDLVTRVQGDTAAVHGCLERGVSDSVKEPFTILAVLGVLISVDWKLTLFGLVFVPITIVPIIILARKARKATAAGLDQTISLSSLLIEQMSGIRVVKAFGLEDRQMERFVGMSNQLLHHNMKKWQTRGLTNPIVESVSMFGAGMLIVYAISTRTPVSSLVTFIPSFFLFYGSFKKLSGLHVVFKESSVAVDRLRDLFARQASVKPAAQPEPMQPFRYDVRFEDVRFAYGVTEVVRGVDVEIKRGRKLGIAGESGCGKSTLLNLLFRFYDPTLGRVAIDGVDLKELALEDLRAQMALVSQDVVLFDLSIADNIGCGKKGATREEIVAAAKAAYAHEFIESMPDGYETRIGERGLRLSGGQRQRLAIARAFVRNAPILVLDEATAALDSQSEAEVQKAIDHLAENRTVICVAHRLITLKGMDDIIVLIKGQIVERGSFVELLRNKSHFAGMAERQGIQAENYG